VVGDEDIGESHVLGRLGEVFDGQRVWFDLCLGENYANFQFLLLICSFKNGILSASGASNPDGGGHQPNYHGGDYQQWPPNLNYHDSDDETDSQQGGNDAQQD
jgi:hypothetical protein